MKQYITSLILSLMMIALICEARIADPYPIALLRQGDIYLLESKNELKKLTDLGDVMDICWLDKETICFSREFQTDLTAQKHWRGFQTISDLFTIKRDGGSLTQFTANHFARGPAPSPMDGRALFWRDNRSLHTKCEIWESIHPVRRDRPLGIRGTSPDSSPDKKWTAASLGQSSVAGVGLFRFPTNDSYKKLRGQYRRPRFSPDSRLLAYINEESGSAEIWGFDIPDGEPRRLLGTGEKIARIVDFGWTEDGSGYILLLEDESGLTDAYYWEIQQKSLHKLTETGDITQATSWH